MSFAQCALLGDRNQLLTRINNEAKVRRSIKSVVLEKGKVKVVSSKDIEVPRATRAAKEVTKGKGKRGRKHKSAVLEAEAESKVAHAAKEVITGKRKRGQKRKSAIQKADEPEQEVAQMIEAPGPWRATWHVCTKAQIAENYPISPKANIP
ncbi:hypothetical protein B0O99DRAFT_709577 [Bisporella sp. PMI_857]|nr:hypothetical protein B0O99DRAFT_709577 [Bisporella sp. PMI_857]